MKRRLPEECVLDRLQMHRVDSAISIQQLVRPDAGDESADVRGHQLAPLKEIARQLEAAGCRTVVVQHPVMDRDYLAEFQTFYSTTFNDYSRYSKRLHFFIQEIGDAPSALDFIEVVGQTPVQQGGYNQTSGYLGYMNVRPIESSPVGRTVIAPPKECAFLTVKESFRSTLAGLDFWVVGTPFMQQDSSVAACAQVAIWMALRVNRKKDSKEDKTVADISEAATKELVFGRVLPTAGLGVQNMQAALEKFGYHGHILNFKRRADEDLRAHSDRILAGLYPYLESGIPIIALCDNNGADYSHSVVVVGHGWNKSAETHHHTSVRKTLKLLQGQMDINSPVVWIDSLFINNDNRGPYQRCDGNSPVCKLDTIKAAMPLLPKDVYIPAEEAETAAHRMLIEAFNAILAVDRFKLNIKDHLDHKFVLRGYLTSRHEFRKWAAKHQSPAMSRYYRQKHLPEKLWVFEVNLLSGYHLGDSGPTQRLGELLIDPTGDPHDLPVLSMHLNLSSVVNEAVGVLMNVEFQPLKIDLIYLDETVKDYPLHIPHVRQSRAESTK
jgi:hypothetical protein